MSSKAQIMYSGAEEEQLMARMWSLDIKDNPYNYVMYAFPWGQKGTPLEHFKGPRSWQKKLLLKIADQVRTNKNLVALGQKPKLFKAARSSGRGIGKSSLVAWLNLWMMSCHLGSTCINTANTEAQLKDKTWAELGKWHTLAINSHWFDRTTLSLTPASWFEALLKDRTLMIDTGYYYAKAITWSEDNPDSFAGNHNMTGMLVVFDEASGIPKPIWTVSSGFFTEPTIYRFWVVFSNPRRNTGPFFECFHSQRDSWENECIDSRTVEGTDVDILNQIIKDNGIDSDEAKIEVYGQFPETGQMQFIGRTLIREATDRAAEHEAAKITDDYAGLIMGVDPARGGDSTIVRFRRGRNAWEIPFIKILGNNMDVANELAHIINTYRPDAVCIDAGAGTGIIDRLREKKFKIEEVWFGAKSKKPQWENKRIEMWNDMREWLSGGGIDNCPTLIDDLAGPEYQWTASGDKRVLESKESMLSRGLASPDHGDALALTFAVKVARKDLSIVKNDKKKVRIAIGAEDSIY